MGLRLLTIDQLWPLLAALLVFVWLVGLSCSRPAWIATLALGVFVYETLFGAPSGMNLGNVLIYPRDGVYAAMVVAAAIRLFGPITDRNRLSATWWAVIALALMSLALGVRSHGANIAGNDFRGMFYVLAAVVYFATRRGDREWIRSVIDIWIGLGVFLALVGLARLAGLRFGASVSQETLAGGRALFAGPTLLIGQAALLAFFAKPLGSRWQRHPWVPYVLLLGVLVFRHRSVWIMMIVSLVAMWTVLKPEQDDSELSGSRRLLAGVAVCVGVMVLLAAGGAVSSFRSDLERSIETVSGRRATSTWRIEGWKYLLEKQSATPANLVIGIPYGSGYVRKVNGTTVNVSPHSWYIQTITRIGVVGLGLLLLALWDTFRRGRAVGLLPRNLGALLVFSSTIYGIAYQPPETQGILIGIVALAGAAAWQSPEREGHVCRPMTAVFG